MTNDEHDKAMMLFVATLGRLQSRMEALEQAVYFLAAKQGISKEEMKKKIKSSTDNIWQFTLANMSSKHPEEARFMDFAGLIAEIEVRLNEN